MPERGRAPQGPVRPAAELVAEIGRRDEEMAALSDELLARRAVELRFRCGSGEPLDSLLVDAFALVRETAWRVLGERPYDVQLLCGIALHRGAVAEMETGEGKTLAAVAPVLLRALEGRGVHVLTYNDYLARRDAAWMGPVFDRLGLSVGCVQEGMEPAARRSAYRADVTYVTAKEAGFDLLRDQLCLRLEDQVHRPFHAALVDEADSILIDEARVPLVIAGNVSRPPGELYRLAEVARRLERGVDFDFDAEGRNVFLTERGSYRVEELLGCDSLFSAEATPLMAQVRNAVHAEALLNRDVDYIVRAGAVEIVDELTGRVAERRHWPDGLQAAVEAKEGVALRDEGTVLGRIALQHFLRLYPHLSGMTGTARPAARELEEMYGLDVVTIPTHRLCIREHLSDRVFLTREAKDRAVIAEVARCHEAGRPVLVGTVSVAESERLAARLRGRGIECRVLNAKNDEEEAVVVADAGRVGAVTISTNMAGRGTDIRLGGEDERERDRVVGLGGLAVIGTNRHDSRRIDDQLRGRAGRQGDPGSARLFVSLEDDLMQRCGIGTHLPARALERSWEGGLEHPLVRGEIDRAQRIVEGQSFDARKRLWEHSSAIEVQRRLVSEWRQSVLDGTACLDLLRERCPERWAELRGRVEEELLERIERRLTLLALDRCWSDHLSELERVRGEIHLVALDGRQPLVELYRTAASAYEELWERVDEEIVSLFRTIEIGLDGVDWEAEGLLGPSATWTYLVSDDVFGDNVLLSLANRPSIGVMAFMLPWLGPVLFVWGIFQHWQKRRKMATLD